MNREQVMYLTSRLITLDKFADVIIVDTGAGISDSVLEFVLASTEVLLVATPEPTSITDAYALLKALNRKDEFVKEDTSIKMISNRVTSLTEGQNLYEKMSVVSEKFLNIPITYLGSVPLDEQISKAVMRQKPVSVLHPEAPSSKAIKQIAETLLVLDTEEVTEKRGMFQLFSNLIRNRMMKK